MNEIKVLTKAFDILEVIVEHRERNCRELAGDLGIPVSTAHRILQNMEDKGYLVRSQQGRYRLGPRFLFLKTGIVEEYDVAEIARPFMEKMVLETRESSNLGVLDGKRVIHIGRIESPEALRANIPTFSLSVHTSATGKLLLAFMPVEEIIASFPERLPAETQNSLTLRDSLLDQLRLIRERHYAVDNQEGFEDVVGYAVPVVNQNEQVIAALSLVGPSSRISSESDEARVATLFRYAGLISRRLGCGRYPYGTRTGDCPKAL
ncbi:MAG: IclR family transcriptional regulator [Desulfocucumaceae bacterium]